MTEHHQESRAQHLGAVLKTAERVGVGDVAGDPDHEQIAEALIEEDLWRDP